MATFVGHLYHFQEKVVHWTNERHCGIIGLDMGLGKTVITLAMISQKQYKHTLIVVPLPIIQQWISAIIKFTDLTRDKICLFHGNQRHNCTLTNFPITITTYDTLRMDYTLLLSFDCMILDEAHKIRNHKTTTYTCCKHLNISDKWLLTGTTIHNSLKDLLTLGHFLDLNETEIRSNYYYLSKSQCCDELKLPSKTLHNHQLTMNKFQREKYKHIMDTENNVLTKLLRLRQCCNHPDATTPINLLSSQTKYDIRTTPKIDKVINICQQCPPNDKILIFSQWSHSLNVIKYHLNQHNIINQSYYGSMTYSEKNSVLFHFQHNDNSRVLLLTLGIGGVGLDLSVANHVILLDSWWNYALESQAIDRVYRIGQTKPVIVHRLYMSDSIECWMSQMKQEKLLIDQSFHEQKDVHIIDKPYLTELFCRHTQMKN